MTDDDEDDATKARPRVGNSATAITSLQNNRPSIVFRFGSWTLFLSVVVVVVVVVVMVVFWSFWFLPLCHWCTRQRLGALATEAVREKN